MGDAADPDIAAGTRLVLDDDRTANGLAEMRNENARHDVGRSGRRERHDDLDRAFGIARRLGPRRAEAGGRGGADQETAGSKNLAARWHYGLLVGHGVSPEVRRP